MRLSLALTLVLLVVAASPAAGERPRPLITEVADARGCQTVGDPTNQDVQEVCVTLQVTRSRFPTGDETTDLFFSLTKNFVEVSGFPGLPFPIDNQCFVMDRDGSRAILTFPCNSLEAPQLSVVWGATDDFRSRSFSIKVVREKTVEGFVKTRVTEREQELSAVAEGVVVGPVTINIGATSEGGELGEALLVVRKRVDQIRLFEEEPDSPDPVE
jgi:hypothetical protein